MVAQDNPFRGISGLFKASLLIIVVSIMTSGCSDEEKPEYYRFSRQITPSGKYVIYNYARYGPMAFSSDISGTELFEISEKFEEGKGTDIPGSFCEWLSKDTLLVYDFRTEKEDQIDTFPIKTTYTRIADFIVKTLYYHSIGGGSDLRTFDAVETTSDSIFLHSKTEFNQIEILKYPLGAITIKTREGAIRKITVDTRLNLQLNCANEGTDSAACYPHITTRSMELTPTHILSPNGLNRRGIFWDE